MICLRINHLNLRSECEIAHFYSILNIVDLSANLADCMVFVKPGSYCSLISPVETGKNYKIDLDSRPQLYRKVLITIIHQQSFERRKPEYKDILLRWGAEIWLERQKNHGSCYIQHFVTGHFWVYIQKTNGLSMSYQALLAYQAQYIVRDIFKRHKIFIFHAFFMSFSNVVSSCLKFVYSATPLKLYIT